MRLTLCSIFLILICDSVKADTLTVSSSSPSSPQVVNGWVSFKPEKFKIEATFRKGETKTYEFDRKHVKSVEINDNYVNQGSPERWMKDNEVIVKPEKRAKLGDKPSQEAGPIEREDTEFYKVPGARPKPNEPDATPAPFPRMIDMETMTVTTPIETTDKIKFNDGESRMGRLVFISSEVITMKFGERAISYNRNLVDRITVGR